jgi:hypothetical protein
LMVIRKHGRFNRTFARDLQGLRPFWPMRQALSRNNYLVR